MLPPHNGRAFGQYTFVESSRVVARARRPGVGLRFIWGRACDVASATANVAILGRPRSIAGIGHGSASGSRLGYDGDRTFPGVCFAVSRSFDRRSGPALTRSERAQSRPTTAPNPPRTSELPA